MYLVIVISPKYITNADDRGRAYMYLSPNKCISQAI